MPLSNQQFIWVDKNGFYENRRLKRWKINRTVLVFAGFCWWEITKYIR